MPQQGHPHKPSIVIARRLRRDMTVAEKKLWEKLRNHQLDGQHFRRQLPIGRFIADFCCRQARLVIEVDGGQHDDNAQDLARTAWLQGQGYRVLRFWNNEVLSNLDGVIETIRASLSPSPPPNPPPEGRGL